MRASGLGRRVPSRAPGRFHPCRGFWDSSRCRRSLGGVVAKGASARSGSNAPGSSCAENDLFLFFVFCKRETLERSSTPFVLGAVIHADCFARVLLLSPVPPESSGLRAAEEDASERWRSPSRSLLPAFGREGDAPPSPSAQRAARSPISVGGSCLRRPRPLTLEQQRLPAPQSIAATGSLPPTLPVPEPRAPPVTAQPWRRTEGLRLGPHGSSLRLGTVLTQCSQARAPSPQATCSHLPPQGPGASGTRPQRSAENDVCSRTQVIPKLTSSELNYVEFEANCCSKHKIPTLRKQLKVQKRPTSDNYYKAAFSYVPVRIKELETDES